MRVLKLWTSEYPWDVRVEKVCQALTAGGHAVHLLARNRTRDALRETFPECVVHRMRPWSRLGRRMDAASQFPAFCNPRWMRHILKVGRAEQVDLILCRDLPLAPAAVWAGRRLGVPMVLDMAENYPAMIRDLWLTGATRFGDTLVRNPRAVEAVERWTVRRAGHIVVVVEESRDRLVALGVPPDRITVVGNTPSASRLDRFPFPRPRDEEPRGRLEVVYLGLLEKARGVGTAIEAVALCRDRGVPVGFTIIGDGRGRQAFEEDATALGLTGDEIRFRGFLPYDEALDIVAGADVGLIPHLAHESWNSTIPNKLFDYMSAGLTVLASDARPTRRVIEETGCGLWFRSGDAEHLAEQMEALWRSETRKAHAGAGRAAIRDRFNWETDGARLVAALEGLARGPRADSRAPSSA
ncbi:MAG: glycosyltransferase family 4 protein [Gemmatimonadota bacterium]